MTAFATTSNSRAPAQRRSRAAATDARRSAPSCENTSSPKRWLGPGRADNPCARRRRDRRASAARRNVPGGVFTRVAQSHIRIGTFQWFAARQDHDEPEGSRRLRHPAPLSRRRAGRKPVSSLCSTDVIQRQAKLIAHWMQLGFIHGVMNTDNMNVSGETIDFGPCAFMDVYDPMKTFSSIDHQGRYALPIRPRSATGTFAASPKPCCRCSTTIRNKRWTKPKLLWTHSTQSIIAELQRRFTAQDWNRSRRHRRREMVETLLAAMSEGECRLHAGIPPSFRRS